MFADYLAKQIQDAHSTFFSNFEVLQKDLERLIQNCKDENIDYERIINSVVSGEELMPQAFMPNNSPN